MSAVGKRRELCKARFLRIAAANGSRGHTDHLTIAQATEVTRRQVGPPLFENGGAFCRKRLGGREHRAGGKGA